MTTQQELDERYGRTSSRTRRWFLGVVVGLAAIVIVAYAAMTAYSSMTDVGAETTGYVLNDDGTVTVSYQLTLPLGRDVACAVQALDEDHGVVGFKVFEYASNDQHTRAFREVIPTVAPATTGLVSECWVT